MLTITFDPAFDQGFWPGPLADKDAAAGEVWVGPMGLLNILESMTGLRGATVPPILRAASLVPAIRSKDGFWSESAQVDPLGTAAKVLQWRDHLKIHGWQGQECSQRLRELAQITKNAFLGFPDRLVEVEKALGFSSNSVSNLNLLEPVHELPHCWQQVLQKLEQTGSTLTNKHITPAKSQGDLRASLKDNFQPQGDGSLQLLRPLTQSQAARETAAWLSGLEDLETTVIIGPDSILDQALHRFGLPTTGASLQVYDNALLQILPLVLEMAWQPPDPQRALELLTLQIGPVPKSIAFRLVRALQDYPAVGSERWHQAMYEGLQSIEDRDRRGKVQSRLKAIFESKVQETTYPASEILTRIELVWNWAIGRMKQNVEQLEWQSLFSQLDNAKRLVYISGIDKFTAPQIKRMINELTQESEQIPLFPHQAGLARVGGPECLVDKAKNVIWWSFNQETAQPAFEDPFSSKEKRALAQEGVKLPDPGKQAERSAMRWQRPHFLTESTLLLVCPQNSTAGEEQFPHPFWDELTGKIENKGKTTPLQKREIISSAKPKKQKRNAAALPKPQHFWRLEQPELLTKPSWESPSSLSSLLSCPLQWIVNYQARLSSGLTASLAEPEELEGWFVHEIVARVLEICRQKPQKMRNATDEAERIFEEQGPTIAAKFFLPGFDHVRAKVRNTTKETAKQILHIVEQGGFGIESVEQTYSQELPNFEYNLEGTPDLVLNSPLAVLDMKRGGINFRQGEIENGTSVQLAVYARLLVTNDEQTFPPAGYFMLWPEQLITAYPQAFPRALHIQGPALEQTWQAVTKGYVSTWNELEQGEVRVPGTDPEAANESTIENGRLILAPCSFCDLDIICGKAFSEE